MPQYHSSEASGRGLGNLLMIFGAAGQWIRESALSNPMVLIALCGLALNFVVSIPAIARSFEVVRDLMRGKRD